MTLAYPPIPKALAWAMIGFACHCSSPAWAQTSGTTEPSKATPATLETVVITGELSDTEARRRSTASKIIVGREEIERFGDATVGEILKRLPGVTVSGRPGRGGPPAMRGLGGGYTQILIDGERAPRGFSLDDLSPEQIERIEILRAPTAETGARAVGGTINIITRGGYLRRLNDVRLGLGHENSNFSPNLSWVRNETMGLFTYNLTLAANQSRRNSDTVTTTLTDNLDTGASTDQREAARVWDKREAVHLNSRLQWRDERGDSLALMPMAIISDSTGGGGSTMTETGGIPPYTSSTRTAKARFDTARLGSEWIYRLHGGGNFNLRLGLGHSDWINSNWQQNENVAPGQNSLQTTSSDQHDLTFNGSAKLTQTLDNQHSLVTGGELEYNRRDETATTLQNGENPLSDFNGDLNASIVRLAVFGQDEWALSPQWGVHVGLRWEGIQTRGSLAQGLPEVFNQSSVLSPLMHAVWKLAPDSHDQVRWSLTRSYRSPNLQDLIARPIINSLYATNGPNEQIHPDRAGNPYLKPELATGLDMALERYVSNSGLFSANLFYRRISKLMRRETDLETVSWASAQRWVSRMQNIGDASTHGIELEAKFRLSDYWPEAPKLDVRSNASVFASQVSGVPGPNNRLAQQPSGTLNLGADYRLPHQPLSVGGSLNWTPAYTTQLTAQQSATVSSKRILDAYVLWSISPAYQVRASVNNFAPRYYDTNGTLIAPNYQGQTVRTLTDTLAPSYLSWQLRIELKL